MSRFSRISDEFASINRMILLAKILPRMIFRALTFSYCGEMEIWDLEFVMTTRVWRRMFENLFVIILFKIASSLRSLRDLVRSFFIKYPPLSY